MKKNEIVEYSSLFISALQGDVGSFAQIGNQISNLPMSLRNKLFIDSLKVFLDEYEKHTSKQERQIGKMLENSKYRTEYGKALLKYIDDMEVDSQVEFMARLAASLSKGFINPDEFFEYAGKIKTTSFVALCFLKDHLGLTSYRLNASFCIPELYKNNLMYEASVGYCFTPLAFKLDKYAISYGNEKYKYNGEADFIPPLDRFPGITQVISAAQTKNPFIE